MRPVESFCYPLRAQKWYAVELIKQGFDPARRNFRVKVLDRYIMRELIIPIFCSACILILLVLITDLFDNLDEFLRYKITFGLMGKYYLSLIPYSFTQIIPWASWLGTLFLLVTFGFNNEIIAMKAAGLKITSIVRPIFCVGFLIGILTFGVSDRLVPKTYRFATDLKEVYIEKKKQTGTDKVLNNVTYLSKNGQLCYFRTFSKAKGEVQDVIGLWLDPKDVNTRRKMVAKKGLWNGSIWVFHEITEYHMDSRGRVLGDPKTYPKKSYAEFNFTPKQLASLASESTFLSYKELKDSIQQLKDNGVSVHSEEVDLQYRLAAPWQALVMMLICSPFLAKTSNRKLIAYNVLICVGIVFAFHVSSAVIVALGKAGKIMPFLGAWGSNIIFGGFGLIRLEKANF